MLATLVVCFARNMTSTSQPLPVPPSPRCEICDAPMQYVSKLPATPTKKAVKVFRCTKCHYVYGEPPL